MDEEREINAAESIGYNRPTGGTIDWGAPVKDPEPAPVPDEPATEAPQDDVDPGFSVDPEPATETPADEPADGPQEPGPEPEAVGPSVEPDPEGWFDGEKDPETEVTGGTSQEGEKPEPAPEPDPEPEPDHEPDPDPTPEEPKSDDSEPLKEGDVTVSVERTDVDVVVNDSHNQDDHSQVITDNSQVTGDTVIDQSVGDQVHIDVDIKKEHHVDVDASQVHVDKSTVTGDTIVDNSRGDQVHVDDHSKGDTNVVINHVTNVTHVQQVAPEPPPAPAPEPDPAPEEPAEQPEVPAEPAAPAPEAPVEPTTPAEPAPATPATNAPAKVVAATTKTPAKEPAKVDLFDPDPDGIKRDYFQEFMNMGAYIFGLDAKEAARIGQMTGQLMDGNYVIPDLSNQEMVDAYFKDPISMAFYIKVMGGANMNGESRFVDAIDYNGVKDRFTAIFGEIEGAPTADGYYDQLSANIAKLTQGADKGEYGTLNPDGKFDMLFIHGGSEIEGIDGTQLTDRPVMGMSPEQVSELLLKLPVEKRQEGLNALIDLDAASMAKYQSDEANYATEEGRHRVETATGIYDKLAEKSEALGQSLERIMEVKSLTTMTDDYISVGTLTFTQLAQRLAQTGVLPYDVNLNDVFGINAESVGSWNAKADELDTEAITLGSAEGDQNTLFDVATMAGAFGKMSGASLIFRAHTQQVVNQFMSENGVQTQVGTDKPATKTPAAQTGMVSQAVVAGRENTAPKINSDRTKQRTDLAEAALGVNTENGGVDSQFGD